MKLAHLQLLGRHDALRQIDTAAASTAATTAASTCTNSSGRTSASGSSRSRRVMSSCSQRPRSPVQRALVKGASQRCTRRGRPGSKSSSISGSTCTGSSRRRRLPLPAAPALQQLPAAQRAALLRRLPRLRRLRRSHQRHLHAMPLQRLWGRARKEPAGGSRGSYGQ